MQLGEDIGRITNKYLRAILFEIYTRLGNSGGGVVYTPGTNINIVGNVISVSDSPTFSGDVKAPAFYETSLRKYKENIKPFTGNALALINDLDIVTYDRIDGIKNKIGIIADDTPKEFLSETEDSVDLYKTIFIQAKAIQELKNELDDLRNKM